MGTHAARTPRQVVSRRMGPGSRWDRKGPRLAYTLIEVLVVVAILGIASAMVIPNVSSAGVLRGQASVRAVVSDLTFAQADAMAFQSGRAIVFDVDENRYVVCSVNGSTIDPETDALYDPSRTDGILGLNLNEGQYANARFESVDIDGGIVLIFDEQGAPVAAPLSNTPSAGGTITILSEGFRYTISIDGFTGHITTDREEVAAGT
ncbi:MAG: type II secretion system protein [Phycisphaerales bacterium]